MLFYVGMSPKTAFLLPPGTNTMLNASQYWHDRDRKWRREGRPRKAGYFFLDSGGFIFFNRFSEYPFSPIQYMNLVAYTRPHFYASLDYPCEPSLTSKLPNLTIKDRIQKTVDNAAALAAEASHVPESTLVPVIQGWTSCQYKYCLDLYADHNLIRPYMAVGSMCVRHNDSDIIDIITDIYNKAISMGVERLHFFGLKMSPQLHTIRHMLYSRDSAAVFFSPNDRIKAEWNGNRFANTTPQKRQAIDHFIKRIHNQGYSTTTT